MNDAHTHHTTAGPDYRRISVLSDSSHRANQSRIHSGRSGLADISISTGVVPSPERQLPHHPAGLSLLSPQSPIAAVSGVIWNNGPQSGQSSPTAARPTSRRQSTTDRFASLDQLKSPRDRTRRPSLKTCNLDEAGLDFPGCFVLVPADAEDHDSLYPDNTHDLQEPKLLTTNKKIYRRPMGDNERAAIKLNRKNGVCLRCKVFKERVSCMPSSIRITLMRISSVVGDYPVSGADRSSYGGLFASQQPSVIKPSFQEAGPTPFRVKGKKKMADY